MTYTKTTPAGTQTTDAEFQAWATALHSAVTTAGLVQTSDTGQVDVTTMVKPIANTSAGYRIYRFNDTLQATAPVFIRLEFGCGSTTAIPRLVVQVGTATNGAGTLSGRFTTAANLVGTALATVDQYVATGLDKSYLAMFWQVSQSTAAWGGSLIIDRSRNPDGTPNGDGLYVLTSTGTAATFQSSTMISYTGAVNVAANATCIVANNATGVQALEVSLFPHFCFTPKLQAPVKSVLACFATDIPYAASVTVSHYGAAPYLSLGNRSNYAAFTNTGVNANGVTLAFRAE